jgi:hypothetical protein
MDKLKWALLAALAVVVVAGLHWTLPSRDIVRIVNTEIARREVETRDSDGRTVTRGVDVRYIHGVTPGGKPRVYRNEDTGWGWPPYFKFNSANLAVEAENAKSSGDDPAWMVVTNYGWRVEFLSWFPNAVALRSAEGPEERLFPWVNVVILVTLAVVAVVLRARILSLFRRG